MTLNYLSGEFSVWLGDLAQLTTDPRDAARVAELRTRSEACAPQELTGLVPRVFEMIDDLCWSSLTNGNIAEFDGRTEVAHGFAQFALAAQLLGDD